MSPLLVGAISALAVATTLSLYRVLRGPTVFDRLTGLGLVGTKTVVLLLMMGVAMGRLDLFIDIALSYGLVSFIGSLVLAKYFETGGAQGEGP
jgi:multicomponent Na+:H+ antiporter subunit F